MADVSVLVKGTPKRLCDPCVRGDHNDCWSLTSDAPVDRCDCPEDKPELHDSAEAWRRAMDF